MDFEEFRSRAEAIFRAIPADYKEGVDGLDVQRATVSHPTIGDVYTLGECLSDFYPSDTGGAGDVRSRIVLYYGSFVQLSRTDTAWDWEEELYETITHEVRHHLEHLASDDALEEVDWAEDQNFARREGGRFDPLFYQAGERGAHGEFRVGDDVFLERIANARSLQRTRRIEIEWNGSPLVARVPDDLADVHFLRLAGASHERGGDAFIVLVSRRGLVETLWRLVAGRGRRVAEDEAVVVRMNA